MSDPRLRDIKIILVEPAGPLNVGAIARVMKNMGLGQLILVNPHCDPVGEDAKRMAVHADDYLTQAQVVETLSEGLVGCERVIATTARSRRLQIATHSPRQILPWLLEGSAALVFGPEDRGLSNDELYHAQAFLQIPTSPEYAALNLAQAVTICCYELRQLVLEDLNPSPETSLQPPVEAGQPQNLAPFQQREAFFQALEAALLEIGYLYPHTAKSRMQKLRQLFNRSHLSAQEVAMLRGMIRQLHWKIQPK
ncbi:RNA methyltransferase [Acaryochloris sp. IP29b_bin.148]|uniref:RNA methyltransferase n=1 Tax=Acaryochloris sp. IP29b_bin.148 TaxID=2969218 RepID=UPI00262BD61D|nr:RNA methyltransferase [Acaryochloris sp. IP29b_bin.148]